MRKYSYPTILRDKIFRYDKLDNIVIMYAKHFVSGTACLGHSKNRYRSSQDRINVHAGCDRQQY